MHHKKYRVIDAVNDLKKSIKKRLNRPSKEVDKLFKDVIKAVNEL